MLTSTKIDAKGSGGELRILTVLSVLADKRKMKPLVILKRAIVQHQNFLVELYCGLPKQGG
jgi:hypothetical protein